MVRAIVAADEDVTEPALLAGGCTSVLILPAGTDPTLAERLDALLRCCVVPDELASVECEAAAE